jgi:glycosyltransferase involved in cell wall biosynthesis
MIWPFSERAGPRALIVDPALHSMGGHHHSAFLRLSRDLDELGVPHECLGSAVADEHVRHMLGVYPCFTESIYGRTEWTYSEFRRRVKLTGTELKRALRWQWKKPDLIILPCGDQVLTLAVAEVIRRYSHRWEPHVVVWLLFGPNHSKPIEDPSNAGLFDEYREEISALRMCLRDDHRLSIFCETPGMAAAFRVALDVPIDTAPGPNLVRSDRVASNRPNIVRPTIACIGHANDPKGYGLLPDAIEQVLRTHPTVKFAIHGAINVFDHGRDRSPLDVLSTLGPRVTVNDNVLSPEDYVSWLEDADLLLLPYDPKIYKSRGSGVFVDATLLGKPVVVTAGCAFAKMAFAEGRAVAIESYDSKGIAAAILTALTRLENLARQATAHSTTRDGKVADEILRSVLAEVRMASHRSQDGTR